MFSCNQMLDTSAQKKWADNITFKLAMLSQSIYKVLQID